MKFSNNFEEFWIISLLEYAEVSIFIPPNDILFCTFNLEAVPFLSSPKSRFESQSDSDDFEIHESQYSLMPSNEFESNLYLANRSNNTSHHHIINPTR